MLHKIDKIIPQRIVINEVSAGQRIDNFLLKILKGVPKSHIYRILRTGGVRVNKKRIKADYHLQFKDQIRMPPIRLAARNVKQPSANSIENLANRIIYEDDGLLIINKPSGVAAHGGSGINFGVIEIVRGMRPNAKFLELAHRLDRDTSGCIIIAKKRCVLLELHNLLMNNQIEKTYLTLVRGIWRGDKRIVDAPLLKNQLQSGERMVRIDATGKPARTIFKLRQQFANTALIEAELHTGRTHQIRVHAAHIGYPIAGDEKYGDKEFNKIIRKMGLRRLFLHAYSLYFTLPSTKKSIRIKIELDKKLEDLLKKLNSISIVNKNAK